MKKRTLLLTILLISVPIGVVALAMRLGPVAAGYKAQTLCSGLYITQRSHDQLLQGELKVKDQPILRLTKTEVDSKNKIVHGIFLGVIQRTAVYREGLGCTLTFNKTTPQLRQQSASFKPSRSKTSDTLPWPLGNQVEPLKTNPDGVDMDRLKLAVGKAFAEPVADKPRQTRAVVVVKEGKIIHERYARDINPALPLQGWSMTKTVMNALLGILSADRKVDLDKPLPDSIWPNPTANHRNITLNHLLHMEAGLEWHESYGSPFGDPVTFSWGTGDRAKLMASRPVLHPPGTKWKYSSGNSYLLADVIRRLQNKSLDDYWNLPRERLFNVIGMDSAVIETDEAGNFGGGGFMYASPRDWARLGLLYLNDGVWNDKRIFPKGWIEYSLKPTLASGKHRYGAQIWRTLPEPYYNKDGIRPKLPDDAYHMVGHWGQFVSVIPSKQMVIVRMGLSMAKWSWDQEQFLADILATVD